MTLDDFLIDKRIVHRNIKNGKVDGSQYRSLLEMLPDLSGKLWRRPEASESVLSSAVEAGSVRPAASRSEPPSVPPAQAQHTPLG
jgi:hypothetical protein